MRAVRLTFAGVGIVAVMAAAINLVRAQDATQTPTFRSGVDIIQLDVSVLAKDRTPVHGLRAEDFTVLENGKPQRVVTLSSVEVAERDPVRSAWMKYATHDVAANDLADELGSGRLFAVVIDDMNLPPDDSDILLAARSAARHVIDLLGPSDRAAVVFAQDAGKTQDFTDDRAKLIEAVDRLQPHQPFALESTSSGPGPGGADMSQRFSSLLARSPCMRVEPAVPALDAVTSRLATVPGRRKTLFYIGVGVPMGAHGSCESAIAGAMRDVYRKAQRANVNIHTVDPGGFDNYRLYLAQQSAARDQEAAISGRRLPPSNLRGLRDFLKTMAESTGGRAVVETDAIEPAIDRIFDEDASYYLLGYEPSNPNADGKFRKIEVTVNKPDVVVRTRSGYWAPEPNGIDNRRGDQTPSSAALTLTGLAMPSAVPLRLSVAPVGRAAGSGRLVDVAATLTVRWPAVRAEVADTLRIVRTIYDADGRASAPVQETTAVTIKPAGADETRVDFQRRVALAPGRYQFRFNVQSTWMKQSGTVYAEVEVPDPYRSPLALSGIVIGAPGSVSASSDGTFTLPLTPTTARDFASGEKIAAFLRIFQGSDGPPAAVQVTTELFDVTDVSQFSQATPLASEQFGANRTAEVQVDVPLDRLKSGPYLLSMTATLPGGRKARRDLVFRVR
ncbi:MAG: VWA domain-containing protein [Acidobacteriota bacterium]